MPTFELPYAVVNDGKKTRALAPAAVTGSVCGLPLQFLRFLAGRPASVPAWNSPPGVDEHTFKFNEALAGHLEELLPSQWADAIRGPAHLWTTRHTANARYSGSPKLDLKNPVVCIFCLHTDKPVELILERAQTAIAFSTGTWVLLDAAESFEISCPRRKDALATMFLSFSMRSYHEEVQLFLKGAPVSKRAKAQGATAGKKRGRRTSIQQVCYVHPDLPENPP